MSTPTAPPGSPRSSRHHRAGGRERHQRARGRAAVRRAGRQRGAGGRGARQGRRPRGRGAVDERTGCMTRWDADEIGFFGVLGGRLMHEALVAALDELTVGWEEAMAEPGFVEEFAVI